MIKTLKILILLLLVTIVVLYFVSLKTNKEVESKNITAGFIETIGFNESLIDPKLNEAKELLAEISKNIKSEEALTQTSFSWWKKNDGILIPLKALSLRLLLPNNSELGNNDDLAVASSTIANFFINKEFNINQTNTDINNGIFYFYAFEKNDLYCTLVLEPASSELGSVYCGVLDETTIENNKPFDGVLRWFDGSQNNLQISVDKIIDNSAKGGISIWHAPSGGFWIAVKKDEAWQQIYIGQEDPPCNLMDENKVPVEIYNNCFEDPSGIMRFPY